MKNRLIHVVAEEVTGDDSVDFKSGEGVALNGHLLFWWDHARDGGNKTLEILQKLERALELERSTFTIKVLAYWMEEDVELCVRGLMIANYGAHSIPNP